MGSAELVLSEIKLGGARNVSKRIDTDENFGRSVLNGVATGDTLWLEVADKVTPPSAPGQASLAIALATALPKAPNRVLALLGEKYPLEQVCGIPFLRADSAEVIGYHDSASTALDRVTAPTLTAKSVRCRAALDEARDRRLKRIDPGYLIKNKPKPARRR